MQATNFKTFVKAGIDLDFFNVIIGSNAAGKSNFIAILQFFKDIAEMGLADAMDPLIALPRRCSIVWFLPGCPVSNF
jgi:predicted ATPase